MEVPTATQKPQLGLISKRLTGGARISQGIFLCTIGIAFSIVSFAVVGCNKAETKKDDSSIITTPVEGAFGWKLGDKLPGNFSVKIDDSGPHPSYKAEYEFTPSKELKLKTTGDDLLGATYVLRLTQDRRICEIFVSGLSSENFSSKPLIQALTEKYGLRNQTSQGTFNNYYFGQESRGVELSLDEPSHTFYHVFLKYKDKELIKTAVSDDDKRREENNSIEKNNLKNSL